MKSSDLREDVILEDENTVIDETKETVEETKDESSLKDEVGKAASSFIKDHIVIICAAFFGLILCIVGLNIRGSAVKEYQAVYANLNDVNNRINKDSIDTVQKTEYRATGVVDGLDKKRWASDDTIITEWIYPAFTFDSAEEYNEHREIYVSRLGTADDFVMEVLPPYIAGYTDIRSEFSTVDDGLGINMKILNFTSYVDGFQDDVYSYVAVVNCSSTRANGETVTSDIILTYSINGKGEVLDFHAATPYIQYNA